MRIQPGILACLLAGCVVQPTSSSPSNRIASNPIEPADANAAVASNPAAGRICSAVLRIGLEHLAPVDGDQGHEPARTVPRRATTVRVTKSRPAREVSLAEPPLTQPRTDYASIDDPLAREALHFVDDMVETDRRRVRREVGLPFFDIQTDAEPRGPLLSSEQGLLEDREQWLQEHGPTLLRRPMQQLLRRLPIAREVDLAFDDFGTDHLAIGEREGSDGRRSWGRVSMRVHASDLRDPVELACIVSHLRVASSQESGRVTLSFDLSSRMDLQLRARTDYTNGEYDLRADLSVHPSAYTSYHVAIGDDMDFLSTSSLYSLFESPMDGAPGLVLYAAHIF